LLYGALGHVQGVAGQREHRRLLGNLVEHEHVRKGIQEVVAQDLSSLGFLLPRPLFTNVAAACRNGACGLLAILQGAVLPAHHSVDTLRELVVVL
jgi:hypothetical protein